MLLLLLWTLVRLRKIGQHKSGPGVKKDTPDGDHVNGQNANGVLQVQEMFNIQIIKLECQPYLNYKTGRNDLHPNGVRGTVKRMDNQYVQVEKKYLHFLLCCYGKFFFREVEGDILTQVPVQVLGIQTVIMKWK